MGMMLVRRRRQAVSDAAKQPVKVEKPEAKTSEAKSAKKTKKKD